MKKTINSLVHLKLFPRTKNNAIDDGTIISPKIFGYQPMQCPECKQALILESVSLEFCGQCGYIHTDYWGLSSDKEKLAMEKQNV